MPFSAANVNFICTHSSTFCTFCIYFNRNILFCSILFTPFQIILKKKGMLKQKKLMTSFQFEFETVTKDAKAASPAV